MRPDAELGVSEPLWNRVSTERIAGGLKINDSDPTNNLLENGATPEEVAFLRGTPIPGSTYSQPPQYKPAIGVRWSPN